MDYCILDDSNTIVNIAIFESEYDADLFGVFPAYDGAKIGDKYNPPIPVSQMDRLEAQMIYTAMMTDTLIGG